MDRVSSRPYFSPLPFLLLLLPFCAQAQQLPVTGDAGPGLESVDRVVLDILERRGVPGASLAIAKNGKLVLARGYGWADVEAQQPVQPEMLFGLASCSKSITAVTVLKLVEQGKLGLDDKVLGIISDIQPPPDRQMDSRWQQITVRMLLNHSGGWDRTKSGDPTGWAQRVARSLNVRPPIGARELIRYMLTQPLDFDPGTREVYSNFGFVLLGQIIEEIGDQPYGEFVQRQTLHPMGIQGMRLNPPRGYVENEAKRYNPGDSEAMRPVHQPMADAAGGWLASSIDMCRFLSAVDGSRQQQFLSDAIMQQMLAQPPAPLHPRENGSWFGLGWDVVEKTERGVLYGKDGGLPGVASWIEHLPGGVDYVVLFNARAHAEDGSPGLVAEARQHLSRAINEIQNWSTDVNLFEIDR